MKQECIVNVLITFLLFFFFFLIKVIAMHDNNEKPREAIGYMIIFPNTNTHIYQLMHTYISSYAYISMKQKAKYVKA